MTPDDLKPTTLRTVHFKELKQAIASTGLPEKYEIIVDEPFKYKVAMAWIFLGFICCYVVEEDTGTVHLEAASASEPYRLAVEHYKFAPKEYRLSLVRDAQNSIVRAINRGQPETTDDWVSLSRSNANPEAVRLNQANSGVAYTVVYPFSGQVRGALMYNFYQYPQLVGKTQWSFMARYTKLVSDQLTP